MTQNTFTRRFHQRIILVAATMASLVANPQAARIAMTPEQWKGRPGKVEFVQHNGTQALQCSSSAEPVVLNGLEFGSGTIEFDVEPRQPDFVSLVFRRQNAEENEIVYLRTWNVGKPTAPDTIQYAPTVKGVLLWDMLGQYQAPAALRSNGWNHVKLIVSGAQLRVFLNDMEKPALEVPRLEGNTQAGGLAVSGAAFFANLEVRESEVESLPAVAGIDPTHNDPRYLRHWTVSPAQPLPPGRELFDGNLPKPDVAWEPIHAERHGLINLSRKFGKSESRRVVWLKLHLRAAAEMKRRLDLGFSDEVWVFVNGGLACVDKNLFGRPVMKPPQGRCSLENTSFTVPLKAGLNELLLGVANDFYGWGIVARLESLDGIEVIE